MFLLYIFAVIIQGVFSATPCSDGVEIISQETKNPKDLIGNWTNVYHWDPRSKFSNEFIPALHCFQLHFEAVNPEFVKTKEAECAQYKMPFSWADAKLRVDAPALKMNGGVITIGEKENWMAIDCYTMVRIVIRKVSDNYLVMINSDMDSQSELIVREPPTLEELKCVAHNVDVGKGMSGFGVCYKN